jgi:phosphatidylethanolamine/phosphatidyl-N-methylethanolamine N-methyltransferase
MLAPIDFASARTIVEFGPGTGAYTQQIVTRLEPRCRYLGIELNPQFARRLATAFPSLIFVHGNVADLTQILATQGIGPVDAIVCGLPWATLPISLQRTVFAAMDLALVPGGVFVTFGYLQSLVLPGAWALRRRLRLSFPEVARSPVVWGNVPPAFAYICRKRM